MMTDSIYLHHYLGQEQINVMLAFWNEFGLLAEAEAVRIICDRAPYGALPLAHRAMEHLIKAKILEAQIVDGIRMISAGPNCGPAIKRHQAAGLI